MIPIIRRLASRMLTGASTRDAGAPVIFWQGRFGAVVMDEARPLGNERFLARLERFTGRQLKPGKRKPKPSAEAGEEVQVFLFNLNGFFSEIDVPII